MGDDWRVCIAFSPLPRSLHSFRRALISALGSRLGDQVTVSSRRWGTRGFFVYAPSIGSADEAAQVAREVLAQHKREHTSPDGALEPAGTEVAGCGQCSPAEMSLPSGRLFTKPVRSESGKRR